MRFIANWKFLLAASLMTMTSIFIGLVLVREPPPIPISTSSRDESKMFEIEIDRTEVLARALREASDPWYESPVRRVIACKDKKRWKALGRAQGDNLRKQAKRLIFEPVPNRYHCNFEPFLDSGAFEFVANASLSLALPTLAGTAFDFPGCALDANLTGRKTDPWGCFMVGPLGLVRLGPRHLRATIKVVSAVLNDRILHPQAKRKSLSGDDYPLVWIESRDDGRSWAWRTDHTGICPLNMAGERVCDPRIATFWLETPFSNNLALSAVPLAREGPESLLAICGIFSGNVGASIPESRLWTSSDCLRNWTAFQEIDRGPCPFMDTLNSFTFDSHFGCWRVFTRDNLARGVRSIRGSSCCARGLADCGPAGAEGDKLPGTPGTLTRWSKWEPVEMPWIDGSEPGTREEYCESAPSASR